MAKQSKLSMGNLIPFTIAGFIFGLVYNALFYPHTLVEFAEAATIGLILGTFGGTLELTIVKRWLRHSPLILSLALRTVIYAFVVVFVLLLVLSVEPSANGECSYFQCLLDYVNSPLFARDLLFSTIFCFITIFSVHVVYLIGIHNFRRLVTGRYHQPRELYAIFMFVDLRSSTTIAEKLGHEKFSSLLRHFFNDIADPIYGAKGEVYQYVGDEVVIVWPGKKDANWLGCYEGMQQVVKKKAPEYLKRYGVVTEFKAGVHGGLVIVTEIGSMKRSYVYHGDVLNTASRIQDQCNQSGFELLVSEDLLNSISDNRQIEFEKVGALPLRGKSEEITIYGFDKRNNRED